MLSIGTISTFQIIKYFQASNTKAIVIPVHQPTNYIDPENKQSQWQDTALTFMSTNLSNTKCPTGVGLS